MIDRVRNRERLDIDAGFGESFTNTHQRPWTIFEKDRKLCRRFQGENLFHLECRMTRAVDSDNRDRQLIG